MKTLVSFDGFLVSTAIIGEKVFSKKFSQLLHPSFGDFGDIPILVKNFTQIIKAPIENMFKQTIVVKNNKDHKDLFLSLEYRSRFSTTSVSQRLQCRLVCTSQHDPGGTDGLRHRVDSGTHRQSHEIAATSHDLLGDRRLKGSAQRTGCIGVQDLQRIALREGKQRVFNELKKTQPCG